MPRRKHRALASTPIVGVALIALSCAESRVSDYSPWLNRGGTTSTGSGGTPGGGDGGSSSGSGGTPTAAGGTESAGGTGGSPPLGGSGGTDSVGGSGGNGGTGAEAGVGGSGGGGTAGAAGGTGGSAGGGNDDCPNASSDCAALAAALLHRYTFAGTGTQIMDEKGSAHGTAIGASLSGTGTLPLNGADQYVDLPNDLLSGLTDATFEAWLVWSGGGTAWQRIFDFGSNDMGEDAQGTGETYLFLTPMAVNTSGRLRAAYTTTGPGDANETLIDASQALPIGTVSHVAVVFDDSGNELRLYLNGALEGSVTLSGTLSAITFQNNWLGRSQFSADPELVGTLREFRIYGAALSESEIQTSYAAGEDPGFLLN